MLQRRFEKWTTYTCCPVTRVVLLHVLSCYTCCPVTRVVLLHVLSSYTWCPLTRVALLHVFSSYTCCPVTRVVLLHVLSCYTCCPLTRVVQLHILDCYTCCPLTRHLVICQSRGIAPFILIFVTRCGCEVCVTSLSLYPFPEHKPRRLCLGGWVGPRGNLDGFGKKYLQTFNHGVKWKLVLVKIGLGNNLIEFVSDHGVRMDGM